MAGYFATHCNPPLEHVMRRWSIVLGCLAISLLVMDVVAAGDEKADRKPVPSVAAQAEAEKLVREVYKSDFARHRAADQLALASKLIAEARDTKDNSAGRFVLYREARDLAVQAGDPVLACTAVDALAAEYIYDLMPAKLDVMQRLAKAAAAPAANRDLADLAASLLNTAIQADEYNLAVRFGDVAATCATRSGSANLRKLVDAKVEMARLAEKEFAQVRSMLPILLERPEDPAANLAVGRFRCLFKGDWDNGVLLLARGSDERLRQVARLDVRRPVNPPEQVEVGDGWWDLAEAERGPIRANLQRRAGHWYKAAAPKLAGLTEAKVQRRLKQIADLVADEPPADSTAVGQSAALDGHTSAISCVIVSSDGRRIVSSAQDKTVRVWDAATGRELVCFKGHNQMVWSVAISPDGRTVASAGADKTIRLWEIETGREINRLEGHNGDVIGVAFLPDGRRLLSTSADQTVRLWSLDNRRELRRFIGHGSNVHRVAVSPDRKTFATSGTDKNIRIWSLQTGRQIGILSGHGAPVYEIAYSPDSHRLYSGGADETWRAWDLDAGKELRHGEGCEALALSPDGKRLVTGGKDGVLRLYEASTGRELGKFPGHSSAIYSVAFFPDGRRAVSGSADRTVRIWQLP
jgi:WD40 repeat protein